MAIIEAVLARVFVDDIDLALPVYVDLAGGGPPRRFTFRDVDLAWVGPFLLLHVPPEQRASYERVATLLVNDIEAAASIVRSAGGTILEGPAGAPNGSRMIAEHPDGAIFEYVQPVEASAR
jgi:hypothetical protein